MNKIFESFKVLIGFLFSVLLLVSPALVGKYLDDNQKLEYKPFIVIDKNLDTIQYKSSQSTNLQMVVKDVETGKYESKIVDTNTYYSYKVGDSIRFVDYSKRVMYIAYGLVINLLMTTVLIAIALTDFTRGE